MEQELVIRLQEGQISFRTQVEIPVTIVDFYFPIEPRPLLAFVDGPVYHALEIFEELERLSKQIYVPDYGRALGPSWLSEKEKAMDWLLKAYEERGYLTWLKVDPIFDPLRRDSRFISLLERLGLTRKV